MMNVNDPTVVTNLPPDSITFPNYVLFEPLLEMYLTYHISRPLEMFGEDKEYYSVGYIPLEHASLITHFSTPEEAQETKDLLLTKVSSSIRDHVERTVIRRIENAITVL